MKIPGQPFQPPRVRSFNHLRDAIAAIASETRPAASPPMTPRELSEAARSFTRYHNATLTDDEAQKVADRMTELYNSVTEPPKPEEPDDPVAKAIVNAHRKAVG